MDNKTIFTKTAKGLGEAVGKTKALSRDFRNILKEIDGKASVEELQGKLSNVSEAKFQDALTALVNGDYIREFASPTAAVDVDLDFTLGANTGEGLTEVSMGVFLHELSSAAAEKRQLKSIEQANNPDAAEQKARADNILHEEQAARAKEDAERHAKAVAEAQAKKNAEEQARRKEEEKSRLEAQARAKKEAEEQARKKALEQARREAEEKARREAEALAKKEAEEQARKKAAEQAQEQARREAEQQAQKAAEEKARLEAAAKAKLEAAEQARQQAELHALQQAQEQARREAEQQAKKDAAEQAKLEAEERARHEAEDLARRKAVVAQIRHDAIEKYKRDIEERARKEAEEKARLAAQEQARQEAEEQARRDAQEQARRDAAEQAQREADEKARLEAEAKAQREAEEHARREAEEQARRDAEEQARREADERARLKEKERIRLEAEQQARREAEEEARYAAKAQAEREAKEKSRLEAEAKVTKEAEERARRKEQERARAKREAARQAEWDAKRQAEREAKERAQLAADALAKQDAEKRAKQEQEREQEAATALEPDEAAAAQAKKQLEDEAAERARQQDEREAAQEAAHEAAQAAMSGNADKPYRKPVKWRQYAALMLIALAVAGVVWVQGMSFDDQARVFEKAATAQFQQPVKIGQVHLALMPQPHWRLEDVAIGKDAQIKVAWIDAIAELGTLFNDRMSIKTIDLGSPVLNEEGLGWLLFGKPQGRDFKSLVVNASNVRLHAQSIGLPAFDARAEIGADGMWQKMVLEEASKKTRIELQPKGETVQIELSADAFAALFGSPFPLEKIVAKGTASRNEIVFTEFNGALYDGVIKGTAKLTWGASWSLTGDVSARQLNTATWAPQLIEGGKLEGSAKYALQGQTAKLLFAAPRLRGNFEIRNGAVLGVELISLLRSFSAGGKSSFSDGSGGFAYESGKIQLRNVQLRAGLVSANGNADVDANNKLNGRFTVDLTAPTRRARAGLAVSGTLKEPRFTP